MKDVLDLERRNTIANYKDFSRERANTMTMMTRPQSGIHLPQFNIKNCIQYTVDSMAMLIQKLRKKAIQKVLLDHEGLPEDPTNFESSNYHFFQKVFETIRKALNQKFKAMQKDSLSPTIKATSPVQSQPEQPSIAEKQTQTEVQKEPEEKAIYCDQPFTESDIEDII